jgi:hypothetical protein
MRLRNLFEAFGEEVAIIFGRFNPPHKGHRAAWELASKSPIWYVGTNESTVGPKDPLPYDVKVEAMKTVWPKVEGHIVPETSWLTLASKVYEKNPNATLLCLTDEDWVTKTIVQYNGKEGAHGFYNFKKIEQKPTPRLSSATALRDAVSKGDRDAFTQAAGVDADTPVAGKPFFDLVAEYLMPYQNAPKKVTKKKVAEPVEGVAEMRGFRGVGGARDRENDENDKIDARLRQQDQQRRDYEQSGKFWLKTKDTQQHISDEFVGKAAANKAALELLKQKPELKGNLLITAYGPDEKQEGVEENFADGKKPGRKGLAKRSGVNTKASVSDLRKTAKNSSGEKQRMAHWMANMKAGRAKNEDAAGVGIITKQNSTVDVNKGTPRKNLKAFRLVK